MAPADLSSLCYLCFWACSSHTVLLRLSQLSRARVATHASPLGRLVHHYSLLFSHDAVVSLEEWYIFCSIHLVSSPTVLPKKDPYSSSSEVSVWHVDVKPPSRSASRLRNVRRCGRGSAQPPLRQGVPGGVGLSYLPPIGCRSPRLLPRSGSAGALSISGCSGFWRRAWRGWPTNLAAALIACRASLP